MTALAVGARRLRALARAASALVLAASVGRAVPASADLAAHDPHQVEAAYLRNFARYVSWPDGAFHDARAPWRMCVLGRDALGDVLERTLRGRTEQDRPFEIHRAHAVEGVHGCHVVFVGYEDSARRRAALAKLKGRPVLTVGDAEAFLEEGGIVQFVVRDTVQLSINLDQARGGALRIPTKMLEVSRLVVENGVPRVLR